MPHPARHRPGDSANGRFHQALAEAQRAEAGRREQPADATDAAHPHPLAGAAFPVEGASRRAAGGVSHWRTALEFIEDLAGPAPPPEPPRAPPETPEAILRELGLTEALTEAELNRLRRLFMWRNHPDRRDESQRAGATRRVAIANMLIDRARARLAEARRR